MIGFSGLLTAIALLSLSTPGYGQPECTLRKEQDGIRVYACDSKLSKLRSIKAVFTINTTLDDLIHVIMDVDNYKNWQYNTINAHVVKMISDTELIYYSEVEAPWPISNRDLVVHLDIQKDITTGSLIVNTNSIPDYIPTKKGIVRVPMSHAQWIVKPISDSLVSVEYTMLIDPGGSVPVWMVNLVVVEAPYKSFRDFKNWIEFH